MKKIGTLTIFRDRGRTPSSPFSLTNPLRRAIYRSVQSKAASSPPHSKGQAATEALSRLARCNENAKPLECGGRVPARRDGDSAFDGGPHVLECGALHPIGGHVCWMRARWRDPKRPRRATPVWKRPNFPAGGRYTTTIRTPTRLHRGMAIPGRGLTGLAAVPAWLRLTLDPNG
jgi:hypothetical protein